MTTDLGNHLLQPPHCVLEETEAQRGKGLVQGHTVN